MDELIRDFNLPPGALSHLTSAVQIGFIAGTLVFAFLSLADRYSPSRLFFVSALLGSLFNLGVTFELNSFATLLSFRFLTGFFLAGIYPVGMKIAADYYEEGLGRSLGFLVGALVLGTAFPHLVKVLTSALPWRLILFITSLIAVVGGFMLWRLVPDGPFRKPMQRPDPTAFFRVFRQREFRKAAFGYFGHMWELYAFWAFVPIILTTYMSLHPGNSINISLTSFIIIGAGGLASACGGFIAEKWGTRQTAGVALSLSCLCCIVAPFMILHDQVQVFLVFMIFWGLVVITDSPLFSTLVAKNAQPEFKGTALTIVNCLGFAITILSIQILNVLYLNYDSVYIYWLLVPGPLLGLLALWGRRIKPRSTN